MKPLLVFIPLIAFVNQLVRPGQIVNSPVAVKGAVGPRFRTWNEFQAGTKGQFVNRAEAARAWAACVVHDIDRDTDVDLFDAAAFAK